MTTPKRKRKASAPRPSAPPAPDCQASKGKTQPRRPMTSEELDALAQITAGDVARAIEAWRRDAPRALKYLLG